MAKDQMVPQHYTRRAKRLANWKEKAAPKLPFEMVFEILTWLSVETLLRLRSVCKEWYAIIEDQNFIEKHLCRGRSFTISFKDKVERPTNSPVTLGLLHNMHVDVLGGCRGLLLQRNLATSKYFIRNAATRQILDLPDPQTPSLGMSLSHIKTTGELYKVVSIYTDLDTGSGERYEVLAIGDHGDLAWKKLEVPALIEAGGKRQYLVTMPTSKAIHFLILVTTTLSYHIQVNSFDLASDTFTSVVLPEKFSLNVRTIRPFNGGGSLAIGATNTKKKNMYILQLKDHKQSKWAESPCVYHLDFLDSEEVEKASPFFIQNKLLWICVGREKVIAYNTSTKKVVYTKVAPEGKMVSDRVRFNRSSLVFLKGMRPDTENRDSTDSRDA